jgi:hypothetical protein
MHEEGISVEPQLSLMDVRCCARLPQEKSGQRLDVDRQRVAGQRGSVGVDRALGRAWGSLLVLINNRSDIWMIELGHE